MQSFVLQPTDDLTLYVSSPAIKNNAINYTDNPELAASFAPGDRLPDNDFVKLPVDLLFSENRADIENLARAFSDELLNEIGYENMEKVIASNESDSDSCASHDYCDANVIMDAAFTEAIGRDYVFFDNDQPDSEKQNQKDTDLINAAWSLAKLNKFYF